MPTFAARTFGDAAESELGTEPSAGLATAVAAAGRSGRSFPGSSHNVAFLLVAQGKPRETTGFGVCPF